MPHNTSTQGIERASYSLGKSQRPFLDELAARIKKMHQDGRLDSEWLGNLRAYFRIKSIYNSNAIEGNSLNVGETKLVVEQGLTLTGKPLKDQAEAKNLKEALDFLEGLARSPKQPITEANVREIHYLVLKGIDDENAGKYRNRSVEIAGSDFPPPAPESVASQMDDFGKWLKSASINDGSYGSLEAILNAAVAHTWFVYIHPFIDGNGRVARLLMNLVLMRFGYPIAIITKEDRLRYYDALEDSQGGDLSSFIALVVECISESLEQYEYAIRQQLEHREWQENIASQFSGEEGVRSRNQYEVWKSAMELLRNYFRQCAEQMDDTVEIGRILFKDFGELQLEKYQSLTRGKSAKKTWFFRVDFIRGEKSARYLFFFGSPSWHLNSTDVTLHLAREEPPNSFYYEKLDKISAPNVPGIVEISYFPKEERFGSRGKSGGVSKHKIENIATRFFNEVISKHFQS